MNDEKKPARDWVKEPYNTWDTLAAMTPPPIPADKRDIEALSARLKNIEALLVELTMLVAKLSND